jgi:hypothetical protein
LRAQRIAASEGQGAPVDAVAEEAAAAATRGTLDALAGEVALCLRYYGVTFRGGQPGRVVLSGPHGAEPRLAEIVAGITRADVVSFREETQAALARDGAGLADWLTAYGLACRPRPSSARVATGQASGRSAA